MKVVETIAAMKAERGKLAGSVGFVPTMGYLHEGHLALVRHARTETLTVIASIFVNPTQFGPQEDFATYPRDPERDLALLEKENVGVVFMPSAQEMYPQGFSSSVAVEGITERLEGKPRPGHFMGVTTVVAKLFNIVQPDRAYFGQKDAQQLAVIRKMVSDLNMNLEIVAVPTVREPDGLAMSSRNTHLSPEERKAAPVLWKALCLARGHWENGEKDAARLRQEMTTLIEREPFAQIEYVSVADPETLEELEKVDSQALVSLAVRIGGTRLIDNTMLGG
ncbi:MAG: pantoate--beta-alanine ligase [Dehalococcoidia bacterium]|nr:MAG: pantoate--beta-alanine ligase [Dehalococcoidia bacterium]